MKSKILPIACCLVIKQNYPHHPFSLAYTPLWHRCTPEIIPWSNVPEHYPYFLADYDSSLQLHLHLMWVWLNAEDPPPWLLIVHNEYSIDFSLNFPYLLARWIDRQHDLRGYLGSHWHTSQRSEFQAHLHLNLNHGRGVYNFLFASHA